MLLAFRIPNIRRRDFRWFSSENGRRSNERVGIVLPSIRGAYGNAPRATVAFVVPPPWMFHSTAKAALASFMSVVRHIVKTKAQPRLSCEALGPG
jgi:hypothetical protein